MPVPDSLQHKIDLFRARGRVVRFDNELFAEAGWLQVMHGQNLKAEGYDPLADLLPVEDTEKYLESIRDVIAQCVEHMPDHAGYIAQHCAAPRR
jgi:tryptophan halogenase